MNDDTTGFYNKHAKNKNKNKNKRCRHAAFPSPPPPQKSPYMGKFRTTTLTAVFLYAKTEHRCPRNARTRQKINTPVTPNLQRPCHTTTNSTWNASSSSTYRFLAVRLSPCTRRSRRRPRPPLPHAPRLPSLPAPTREAGCRSPR